MKVLKMGQGQLNGGFTAFSAGDTVIEAYLVFLDTFKLSNNLMSPKTGALS